MRLSARGVSKQYGGVTVLRNVDLAVASGEIRALVGENGAGKSTLIKILSGAVAPDSGEVRLDDVPLPPGRPLAVQHRGLSIVYQEFTLVPDLTVAENVFLGRELGAPFLRRHAMRERTRQLLTELGVDVDAGAPVRGLSIARQQMVEIARALATEARVIVLDEPSATLSTQEVDTLMAVLKRLRARGLAIIYVSHRLDEVFQLCDSVTVLRDGRHVTTAAASTFTRESLIRHMVGRDVAEEFPTRSTRPGAVALRVEALSAPPRFTAVSVSVRSGEIVGMAGLVGSGRTSVALALVGALPATGRVEVGGTPVAFGTPAEAIAGGIAYVTEDRKARGIFAMLGVDDNITITHLSTFARKGLLSIAEQQTAASAAVESFDIRTAGLTQRAGTLSGGNQQKALVARYLVRLPRVLILDEPTRGVDVGARAEIYRTMNRMTAAGVGILMISSDLPEVLGLSDRIVVMRSGHTVGEFTRGEATAERVMALATA